MKNISIALALLAASCGSVHQDDSANKTPEKTPEEAMGGGGVLRMSWIGPGRKPLDQQMRDRNCRNPYELRSLQYGESLWTICEPGETFHGGVLNRLDPLKKEAQSLWEFPQMFALDQIVGIAPLPDEQIAILYRLAGMQEKSSFALAITGPDGWALPPIDVATSKNLLGFAWNKDHLEIVSTDDNEPKSITPRFSSDPPGAPAKIVIASYSPKGERSERSFEVQCEATTGFNECAILGAYLHDGESTWRTLVASDKIVYEYKEDLSKTQSELLGSDYLRISSELDLSVSGLLHSHSFSITQTLLSSGKVIPHPDAPRGVEREDSESHFSRYRVENGRLTTYCLWTMIGSRATLQSVNGRLLFTDLIQKTGMLAITDTTNPSAPKEKQVGPIAGKVFRWRCTDLQEGSFVAKKNGGYWLIGDNGCYVDLPGVW